jgi:hypothetical protein
LTIWDIDSFLAPIDIEVSAEWEDKIIKNNK